MNFLWDLLGGTILGKILVTLIISMVPVIELRGAIPIAVLLHDMDPILACALSIIGNLIPVPFIIIFIRKIFAWIRRRLPKMNSFIDRLEEKGKSKRSTVEKYGFWGLFIFVALPLPGTGAWTGALIAAMMDMRLKRAFPSIVMGVVTAGIIVTVLTTAGLAAYIGFSA